MFRIEELRPIIMGFPVIVLKPASNAVGSAGSFLFAAYARKNVFFAHRTSPPPRLLVSQSTNNGQIWRAYALLSVRPSLPSLRSVPCLCLEVSLDTWVPSPFLDHLFLVGNDLLFWYCKILIQNWVRPPRPKRDVETQDHLRPSNLAARALR